MRKPEPLDEVTMQQISLQYVQAMAAHEVKHMDAETLQYAEDHYDTWDSRNSASRLSKALGIPVEVATNYFATIHARAIGMARKKLEEKVA